MFANPGGGDTTTLLLRAQSTSMPERSFGDILIPFKATPGINFPGKASNPHAWTVTFAEGEDRAILNAMYDWMNSILNDKTGLGSVSFKKDIYLHLINSDGTVAKKYKMVGCYPKSIGEVALGMDTETPVMYPIIFAYDRWELV